MREIEIKIVNKGIIQSVNYEIRLDGLFIVCWPSVTVYARIVSAVLFLMYTSTIRNNSRVWRSITLDGIDIDIVNIPNYADMSLCSI